MRLTLTCIGLLMLAACGSSTVTPNSVEMISQTGEQDSLFRNLITLSHSSLPDSIPHDSLVFLVLPLQASCPSCRNKTIDSIVKHQTNLAKNHFIVLSANGVRKTMTSYFRERNAELLDLKNQLILDSTNIAFKLHLFNDNPAIYYSAGGKVYKKILAIPATVKQDLQEFFSAYRNVISKKTEAH